MIWYRLYEKREKVLALADEELMGKEFEEGRLQLKVGGFYKGELIEEERVRDLVGKATVINAVGERAVEILLRAGLAGTLIEVAGVPHTQVIRFK